MLSLAKVTREMGEHYFSNDEYYSRESGPAKPEFYGRGADILGIKNDFNSITFQKLLEGVGPSGEQLRVKKQKTFAKKGKDSFEKIMKTFLDSISSKKNGLDETKINLSLLKVEALEKADIKFKKNFEEIHEILKNNPNTKNLNEKHRNKLIRKLIVELCELGTPWGDNIKSLPEYYLISKDKEGNHLIDKLIERSLFLEKESTNNFGLDLYFSALDKYFPDDSKKYSDYKTNKEVREKLHRLILKLPPIGLWKDENILIPEAERSKLLGDLTQKIAEKREKLKGSTLTLEEINNAMEEAEKQSLKDISISLDQFTEKFGPRLSIDLPSKSVEFSPKYHLNVEQSKRLRAELISNLDDKEDRESIKKIDHFIGKISKTSNRSAIDLTFSAPKSVSLLAILKGEKKALEAHQEAVKFTLDYIEGRYFGTRRGTKESRFFQNTENLVAGLFHHGTSRLQDPQLHTHCVVMNTTYCEDNKWRANHNDLIYKHSKLFGIIYQKKLADMIMELGYEIEPKANGTFEVAGYNPDHLSHFSKRTKQIDENISLKGLENNGWNRSRSVLENRRSKKVLAQEDQFLSWKHEAEEINLIHPTKKEFVEKEEINWTVSKENLTETKGLYQEEDLLLDTILFNFDKGTAEEILKDGIKNAEIKFINQKGKVANITSHKTIKAEQRVVDIIKSTKNSFDPINEKIDVDEVSAHRNYTVGQRDSFALSMTNRDMVVAWEGVAGSGKSYALKDVCDQAESEGYAVLLAGADGSATKELSNSVNRKAKTLDSLLKRELPSSGKKLIVVDEAGKIDTAKMLRLLEKSLKDGETRVLLVGDDRQFGAIKSGNPFQLITKNGVSKSELKEHRRQKSIDLKEGVELASKKVSLNDSFDQLEGKIIEKKTREARLRNFCKSYLRLCPEERDKTLLLADSHKDRDDLTSALRSSLKVEGSISSKEKEILVLKSRNISSIQKKALTSFEIGDVIVPFFDHVKAKMIKDYQYEITKINKREGVISLKSRNFETSFKLKDFNDFSLYRKEKLIVSEGDKIRVTKNYGSLTNNDILTVKSMGENSITFSENSLTLDTSEMLHYLEHGLVRTTYSSQGKTTDKVIYLAENNVSAESWYVTLSRVKNDIEIITANKDRLKRQIGRSSKNLNATPLLEDKNLVMNIKDKEVVNSEPMPERGL